MVYTVVFPRGTGSWSALLEHRGLVTRHTDVYLTGYSLTEAGRTHVAELV